MLHSVADGEEASTQPGLRCLEKGHLRLSAFISCGWVSAGLEFILKAAALPSAVSRPWTVNDHGPVRLGPFRAVAVVSSASLL